MEEARVLMGSDQDLGNFLVRRNVITATQLEDLFQLQRQVQSSSGTMPWLGQLVLDKGYVADKDALRSLGSGSSAPLRCQTCGTSFQVWYYDPAASYSCPACEGVLGKDTGPVASPMADLHRAIRQRQRILTGLLCGLGVSLVLLIILLARKDPARPIVQRAHRHLSEEDWAALEADVQEIEKLSKKNPAISFFRQKLDRRKGDLDRRRKEWQEALDALKSLPLEEGLRALKARYKESSDMQEEFLAGLQKTLAEIDQALVQEGQAALGNGVPGANWLGDTLKDRARRVMDRARGIIGLEKDAVFPYKASLALSALPGQLQKIVSYRGTWELKVNVAPFAEVVVRSGTKEMARDWTPLVLRGLDIGGGDCQVDLFWPSRDDPRQRHTADLSALRNGQVVLVGGDLESGRVQVSR